MGTLPRPLLREEGLVKRTSRRRGWINLAYLILAGIALVNGGFLWIAAGCAGGAAVGYAYVNGKGCQTFNAAFDDAWAAARTALVGLGMPLDSEQRESSGWGTIESHTADGERVRIHLDALASKFPAEGPLTRISVRVATFGDHPVSYRLLDQIGAHLVAAPAMGSLAPGV